ncbi:MAG: hypothetical protein NTU80_07975 [Verrucomicrobia bacterium]|nr:hypothetical protein [Verrucomicrobiota bacterium]
MPNRLQNYLIIILLCISVSAVAVAVRARQQLAAALAAPSLQVKRSAYTASSAPTPLTPPPAAAPNPPAPEDNTPPAAPPERPEGVPPFNRGDRPGGARFAAQMGELLKDPEFAAAWKIDQEARLDARYSALFKQLNLPPEKLAALKTLLVERESAAREVFASAASQGMNPRENRDQLRQLANTLQAEVDANIKTTFGDSVAQALATYTETGPQRALVNELTQKLNYTGLPLNDGQTRQLTRILAETGTPSGRSVLITDATLTQAAGVLTASQLADLKKLQSEQQARQTLEAKMRAAREAASN